MRWLYAVWLSMWLAVLHGQPVVVAKNSPSQFSNTGVSDHGNSSKALRPGALVEVSLRSTLVGRTGPPDDDVGAVESAELPVSWITHTARPGIGADGRIARQLTGGQHRPRAPPA